MQRQVSLFGQRVQQVNEKFQKAEEPWKDVCCRACWFAKRERCVCKCGGKYHGKGRVEERAAEPERDEDAASLHHREALDGSVTAPLLSPRS